MFYKWKAAGLLAIALILGGIWSDFCKGSGRGLYGDLYGDRWHQRERQRSARDQ